MRVIVLLLSIIFCPAASLAISTATPIRYLVVIFQENRSFDHYFATYPKAQNNLGETPFFAKKNTPAVNGLSLPLLVKNENLYQPFRLSPALAAAFECSPAHRYTSLQQACHAGLMDKFVESSISSCPDHPEIVMGYFDGNTVTALWNYAQHFAMSDNFHTTHIGGSTVGAINLISGQVHGATPSSLPDIVVDGTLINDIDPKYDRCSQTPQTVKLSGINIGNLLNHKKITWGWFQGGFANCKSKHLAPGGVEVIDYVPHHNPFQFYKSTSNPKHRPPKSYKEVGKMGRANHNYDLKDFWKAAEHGRIPRVSFFKAAAYQNGHPQNSDPLLEQEFLVDTINKLQLLPQWRHMAVIIAYDDSGGWYDHQMPPIINQSQISNDALIGPGNAGNKPPLGGYQGRIGYGLRVPFLLISPWSKRNFVDSTLIDQTSITRFIEDNWFLPRIGDASFDEFAGSIINMFDFKSHPHLRPLILNPKTGAIPGTKPAKRKIHRPAV